MECLNSDRIAFSYTFTNEYYLMHVVSLVLLIFSLIAYWFVFLAQKLVKNVLKRYIANKTFF